jgi:hypothetical protein
MYSFCGILCLSDVSIEVEVGHCIQFRVSWRKYQVFTLHFFKILRHIFTFFSHILLSVPRALVSYNSLNLITAINLIRGTIHICQFTTTYVQLSPSASYLLCLRLKYCFQCLSCIYVFPLEWEEKIRSILQNEEKCIFLQVLIFSFRITQWKTQLCERSSINHFRRFIV